MKFNKIKIKGKKIILISVIAVFTIISVSFVVNRDHAFESVKQLDIFYSLYKELNLYYVDEIIPGDIIKTGIDAMLKSLDPYSEYIQESNIEEIRIMTTGQYGGIGALIRKHSEYVVIAHPYQGRPADKSGIVAGDIILKIDGINIKDKKVSEVSELLKGAPNSTVELIIERPGHKEEIKKTVIREDIKLDAVPYYGIIGNNIGYITLNNFTNTAGRDVKDAFKELKNDNEINAIIIDLRGNPGGLLLEAVKIVNLFVDKGQEVVSTRGKVAQWDNIYRAVEEPLDTEIKIAVLVDRSSASASEIVAGALQDLDRGVIIGQQTFGKGLVQTTRELSYNAVLKVTTAKYYIPSGRCIQALDYSHRDEEGKAVRVPDSLLTEFSTLNGRIVYEGGGIIPDITIEPTMLSKISTSLILKNLTFDYATIYRQKNPEIATPEEYEFTELEYDKFVEFLADKDFDYETKTEEKLRKLIESAKNEKYYERADKEFEILKDKLSHDKNKDLQVFKEEIIQLLSQEIILRYYYEKGGIIYSLKHDPEIKKAIEIISDKDIYNKILDGTYKENI